MWHALKAPASVYGMAFDPEKRLFAQMYDKKLNQLRQNKCQTAIKAEVSINCTLYRKKK